MKNDKGLVVFQGKNIRRVWNNGEWYFSVVDVVMALTDSADAKDYWYRLKKREFETSGIELSTFCRQLKLESADGKSYFTDCSNTKSIFRIIQSIPSKKAEPFKQWLAQVGYERVQEINDPELAQDRMKQLYEQKGYPKSWIDKRLRGIAVRQDLTDEWRKRGVESQEGFSILTAEISKASFGLTPSEYKQLKGLDKENLRDHMNDLELIFTMLGEASTSEIEKVKDPKTFNEHREVSKDGGKIAKNARKELEQKTGKPVVSGQNFLNLPVGRKALESKKK